jgi:hypothetical protein
LSGLVSVILILGQASAVLHFELVPHRFCLLHGLEDIQVLDGAPAHAHASAARASRDKRTTARAPRTIVVSHDRCALAMLVHERLAFLPAERSIDIPGPDSTGLVHPARDAALLPARPELDFAPKIGPPA